ncbi:hypothetical protein WDU94_008529 [Cyamophila willieti]
MSDKDKTWKLKLNKSENIVIKSDEHAEYFREISSHHVKVNLGFKSGHLESTSCMNLTDMVNYSWPLVKSTENLIAVHQSGKYIAYGIFINNSNTKSSVRIHDVDSDSRHRLDDLLFPVADLAFVSSSDELMLAVIDVKGSVFIYNLYFLNGQFHYEKYLEVMASETSAPGPYKLVWYAGDKESSIPRALAVTRGKKIEIWNVETIYSSHNNIATSSALPISILREHIIEMNQHTDLVTRVCFSVDGAAVATASLDGRIMFFQILDLDEPNVPKPLHSWEPHGGAPVTHMLLLDNYEDDVFWRFLVSFSNDNSVMKIWSCESWLCLQTFSFCGPLSGDVIHMIPYVDRYSKYIYLSDCHNKVFYVLELFSDPERPIAYVYKFAAFLVISPILSIHVNSCDRVPRQTSGHTGLMLSGDDDDDIDTDFGDLRGRDLNILHDNRIRLYILQPKSLQNCVLLFPSLPIIPDPSRMVLVDQDSDSTSNDMDMLDEEEDLANTTVIDKTVPVQPVNVPSSHLQDARDSELIAKKLEAYLGATQAHQTSPLPPPSSQHLDLMTPDAFTSSTSLHNSPHGLHQPTNEVLGSIPIVDVSTLENKMKNKVSSQTNSTGGGGGNYRDVSSGSSPSREVEEIMQPYTTEINITPQDKVQEVTASNIDNTDWPEAPPIHKIKTEKKTPLLDQTQAKKQRAYNGGTLFNEDLGVGPPDPALDSIVLSLQKMALSIQTLSTQVGSTVTILQQSKAAIECQGQQLAALEKRVERLSLETANVHNVKPAPADVKEERRQQELLVSQITQSVQNIISDKVQSLIVTQFNTTLLPALLESMTPLKNQLQADPLKLTATDHLLKENLAKVVQSKTVLDTITSAVLQNLQSNMRDCFKEYFRKSVLDYQKSSHTMFKQLSETYEQGVRAILAELTQNSEGVRKQSLECVSQVHQVAESLNSANRNLNVAFSNSLINLETNINETLTKHLSSQKAVLEGAVLSAVQSRTVTPVPTPNTAQQLQQLQNQIKTFLVQKQYNAAFLKALTAQNLALVLSVCESVEPSILFDTGVNACPLEQHVLISLIQQLGGDLATQSQLKCTYIDEALGALDINNSSTREHAPKIIKDTLNRLKTFSMSNSGHSAVKHVKRLERVIQGVLRDFEGRG